MTDEDIDWVAKAQSTVPECPAGLVVLTIGDTRKCGDRLRN